MLHVMEQVQCSHTLGKDVKAKLLHLFIREIPNIELIIFRDIDCQLPMQVGEAHFYQDLLISGTVIVDGVYHIIQR